MRSAQLRWRLKCRINRRDVKIMRRFDSAQWPSFRSDTAPHYGNSRLTVYSGAEPTLKSKKFSLDLSCVKAIAKGFVIF
jgi:hypothetical protein